MSSSLQDAHEALITFALSLPGTREDHPWGERVAKVGKKVFVFFGRTTPDEPRLMFAVKLPHSGVRALDLPFTEPTGYGMGKHGWVSATFTPGDRPQMELLQTWIVESYRAIAPKKLVAELDARAGESAAPAAKPAEKPKAAKRRTQAAPARKPSPARKKTPSARGAKARSR